MINETLKVPTESNEKEDYEPKPVTIHYNENFFLDEERVKSKKYLKFAAQMVSDKQNFLGEGGAAKVFDAKDGTCIKILRNRHKEISKGYDLGNSPEKEFDYLERLHGFERSGCRSPIAEMCIEVGDAALIVMEKLDAVNLQLVFNGQEELPEGFDFEAFYKSLEGYIGSLHAEVGIAHNDLYPRNIMVDRNTGMPYVIDFGRSVAVDATAIQKSPAVNGDWDNFDLVFEKLEGFRNGEVSTKKEVYQSGVVHLTFSEDIKVFYSRKLLQLAERVLSSSSDLSNFGIVELEKAGSMTVYISDTNHNLGYAQKVEYQGLTFYIGKLINS